MIKGMLCFCLLFSVAFSAYAEDMLYVTVEKTPTKWNYVGMSLVRQSRKNLQQEVLETDRYVGTKILPSFDKSEECVYIGGYRRKVLDSYIDYSDVYSCVQRPDKSKYIATNSQLTGFIDTDFFFIAGRSRYSVQVETMLRQSGVLDQIQACRTAHYKEAAAFSENKISIRPKVKDLSGFYDGSELVEATKTFGNYDCMIDDVSDILHTVQISKKASSFVFDIDGTSYNGKQIVGDYVIEPEVTVLAKKYSGLTVNDTFKNQNIKIKIKDINYASGNINISLSITNDTKEFVKFQSLALYLNDDVLSLTSDKLLELPPKTHKDGLVYRFSATNEAKRIIDGEISNKNKDDEVAIGISAKYLVSDNVKTIYDTKTYTRKKLAVISR